jgi:hypothetical protein
VTVQFVDALIRLLAFEPRTIDLLFSYPRPVAICVLPGILAAVMGAMELPRDVVVAMLDSALDDIRNGTS